MDYVRYVEDSKNGLLVSLQNINNIRYTLQYQPADYLVFEELKSVSVSSEDFKTQYKRFKGLEHYVFKINRRAFDSLAEQKNDTSKTKKRLNDYFDFNIQKDIKLVNGNDTISCSISQCESSFGMTPYYTFVVGFENKTIEGDRTFYFNGKKIGVGDVKLEVSGRSIDKIPELNM